MASNDKILMVIITIIVITYWPQNFIIQMVQKVSPTGSKIVLHIQEMLAFLYATDLLTNGSNPQHSFSVLMFTIFRRI